MKKIFSLLLVLSLLFTTPVCFAEGSDDSVIPAYENEISELKVIGILSDAFDPVKVVTRGEFTKYLVNLSGLSELGVYGKNVYFSDVPQTSEYFSSVAYCVEKGYVSGYSDKTFRPENGITPEEAVKVLIHLLGYDYLSDVSGGGYAAYISTAQQIGLTKGISLPYGEKLLGGEVAKLIYNALEIPLVMMTGKNGDSGVYEINNDKTILSEIYKMGRVSGIVYATSISGHSGYEATEDKYAVIGGETLYSETNSAWEYLGFNVDVLYKNNEEKNRKEILSLNPNNKNKVIEVSKEDFSKIDNGKFCYTLDEKDIDVTVTRFFEFIYNGKSQTYDTNLINTAKYGRFTLISNDGSNNYTIVKFESFSTIYVNRVEKENETVYSENSSLELKTDEKLIVIKDKDSKRITIDDIGPSDVVTYYSNGDYIFAYVSRNKLAVKIDAVNSGDKTFESDGKEYKFASDVTDNLYKYLSFNKEYSIYLDIFGNVGFIEAIAGANGNIYFSYGVENGKGEMDEDIFLVAFSLDSMKKERIQVRNNVTVNGALQKDVERAFLKETLIKGLPFVARKNEAGLITHIETARPGSDFSQEEDGFVAHFYQSKTNHYTDKAYYIRDTKSYNNQVYVDANTKVLIIPSDFNNAEEKDFVLGELFKDNMTYHQVAAYSFSKDSVYADLIVYPSAVYYKNTTEESSKCAVILDIRNAVDELGEQFTKINYMSENEESYACVYSDMEASNYQIKISELQKGDIINLTTDSQKRVISYNLVLDNNQDKTKIVFKGSDKHYDPYIAHSGMFYAQITDVKGEFLKLKLAAEMIKATATNAAEVYNGEFYQRYTDLPITVVSISGNVVRVEKGGFSDLVKDAEIIYSTYAGEATSIIVLK